MLNFTASHFTVYAVIRAPFQLIKLKVEKNQYMLHPKSNQI